MTTDDIEVFGQNSIRISVVGNPTDGEAFAKLLEPPVKVELKIKF